MIRCPRCHKHPARCECETKTVSSTAPIADDVLKLAIVNSVCGLLAETNFAIMDGVESELTYTDGRVFVISIRRK